MRATERQHHAEEELARLTYELDRVEEGRRRLRAALAEQRAAAEAHAEEMHAHLRSVEEEAAQAGDVVAAHGQLLDTLRTRLDAASAEEGARAHDLCAAVAALQLTATLMMAKQQSDQLPAAAPPAGESYFESWATWLGESNRAATEALVADLRGRLSELDALVQKTSLPSLLEHASSLLQHQSSHPGIDAARALQAHSAEAAGPGPAAGADAAEPQGPSGRPEAQAPPELALQRLLDLMGDAAASLEQVAGHRAASSREMRELAWQFRALPRSTHPLIELPGDDEARSPGAVQAELQAQACEAALSTELHAVEQQLLFCAAPMHAQLAAVANAERSAAGAQSRALAAERELGAARRRIEALERESADKDARTAAAEQRAASAEEREAAEAAMVRGLRSRAEEAEAVGAALKARLEVIVKSYDVDHEEQSAKSRGQDQDDQNLEVSGAASRHPRTKARPRLSEEAPARREAGGGAAVARDGANGGLTDEAAAAAAADPKGDRALEGGDGQLSAAARRRYTMGMD